MSSPGKSSSTPPDLSILGDQVTLRPGVESHDTHDRNLVSHMARFRESPLDFLREISLHVAGEGWRSYDNIVGQPIFYSGFTDNIKAAVLSYPTLQSKIAELADQRVRVEEEEQTLSRDDPMFEVKKAKRKEDIKASLKQVAETMTDNMVCKMESKKFIRGAYYFATQLLTRAYHQGIHVSSEEVLKLRAVAEQAQKDGQSIIFLPCHRSHVDYVSLQLICYRLGLALPTVVAGDNLNFPLVGPFLQHAGAMWIRRSFGDDVLYQTILQAYIDVLLQKGLNFECFIEGGRSRNGKLLPPKFGILSFLLDSVVSGRVNDAIVCPVSTQYDKVIEVDSYVNELLGVPKEKENLKDFLSASSVLSLKLGRVDVRFHEPWSLRGFIDEQRDRFTKLSGSQQAELQRAYNSDMRLRLLRTLGYKVLADINDASVVMPTALIGTVLLTLRGRGVGKSELIRRVDWLSDRVLTHGGRVAHFEGLPTAAVVERGLEVLGPGLIGVQKDLAEDTYYAVDRFQLSFYRNMTIHLFISEAIVCASLYHRIKGGGPPETQKTPYQELASQVSFLSQLFRDEFIFPTAGLAANLSQTVAGLESDGVVKVTRKPGSEEIETVELSDSERQNGRENFDFYCFLIWPFVEATWLGAVSLLMLVPPETAADASDDDDSREWLDMRAVQSHAQLLGKTLYAQGDISYFEAVNKETLKNAYARFREEGIIIVRAPPRQLRSTVAEMVRLADDWMPHRSEGALQPEGRLWEFCDEISKSRLEGKNRRDGDDVTHRTLGLVETVGRKVWDGNVVGAQSRREAGGSRDAAGQDESRAKKEKRRRAPMRSRAKL